MVVTCRGMHASACTRVRWLESFGTARWPLDDEGKEMTSRGRKWARYASAVRTRGTYARYVCVLRHVRVTCALRAHTSRDEYEDGSKLSHRAKMLDARKIFASLTRRMRRSIRIILSTPRSPFSEMSIPIMMVSIGMTETKSSRNHVLA